MTEIVLDRRMSCPLFFGSLLNSLLATRAVSEAVRSLALVSGRIMSLYITVRPR